MSVFIHDPNAVLDYAVDWSGWIEDGDSINTINVAVESGDVVIDAAPAPSETAGVVTAWLSGGTPDTDARVRYRVTTAQGRIDDRSIWLKVRER